MSTRDVPRSRYGVLILCAAVLAAGCGGKGDVVRELSMVPGTYLLHIHAGSELGSDVVELALHYFPQTGLAARMLEEGPLGVSVVSVDITTMEPQFLLLSRDVSTSEAVGMAEEVLGITPETRETRIDFVTERGQVRGAAASRNGWTCVYLGPAPGVVVRQWLELEEETSMAADSALVSVVPEGHDLTVLVSGNLIGFVSLLPLDRWYPGWSRIDDVLSTVRPTALGIGITWRDSSHTASLEVSAARLGGQVTRMCLEIGDSAVTTDMIWPLVESAMGVRRR